MASDVSEQSLHGMLDFIHYVLGLLILKCNNNSHDFSKSLTCYWTLACPSPLYSSATKVWNVSPGGSSNAGPGTGAKHDFRSGHEDFWKICLSFHHQPSHGLGLWSSVCLALEEIQRQHLPTGIPLMYGTHCSKWFCHFHCWSLISSLDLSGLLNLLMQLGSTQAGTGIVRDKDLLYTSLTPVSSLQVNLHCYWHDWLEPRITNKARQMCQGLPKTLLSLFPDWDWVMHSFGLIPPGLGFIIPAEPIANPTLTHLHKSDRQNCVAEFKACMSKFELRTSAASNIQYRA